MINIPCSQIHSIVLIPIFTLRIHRRGRRMKVVHHTRGKNVASVNSSVQNASESGCPGIHGQTWHKIVSNVRLRFILTNRSVYIFSVDFCIGLTLIHIGFRLYCSGHWKNLMAWTCRINRNCILRHTVKCAKKLVITAVKVLKHSIYRFHILFFFKYQASPNWPNWFK